MIFSPCCLISLKEEHKLLLLAWRCGEVMRRGRFGSPQPIPRAGVHKESHGCVQFLSWMGMGCGLKGAENVIAVFSFLPFFFLSMCGFRTSLVVWNFRGRRTRFVVTLIVALKNVISFPSSYKMLTAICKCKANLVKQ